MRRMYEYGEALISVRLDIDHVTRYTFLEGRKLLNVYVYDKSK